MRRHKYEDYIFWLADLSGIDMRRYGEVVQTMMSIDFVWTVPNDENRAADALNLRHEFEFEWGEIPELIGESPKVYEVLVKMAIRGAELIGDRDEDDKTPYFFGVMMSNLKLNKYPNGAFNEQKVSEIIFKWMDRDPNYPLFKVKNPPKAFENAEFWNQMNWFLTEFYYENYGFDDDNYL